MPGRGFLDVARDLAIGPTEYHWRASAIHTYYALFLECRDTLFDWGFVMPRRDNVHAWVRLRFTYAAGPDLKTIGYRLDDLVRVRNQASYDLAPQPILFSTAKAQAAIQDAANALASLDQTVSDPARRSAAIAALGP